MSLQVWLPLNGDLHNQGLSNITVTNNGATVNNDGKIGKCYSFNGSNQRIDIGYGNQKKCNNFSASLWVKPLTSLNNKMVIGVTNGNNQRLYIGVKNNTYNLAFGPNTWGRTTTANATINTWSHLTITIKNNECRLYQNGVFIESLSASSEFVFSSNIYIGGRTDGYYANCMINDVRIYDHCLSEKEVQEIAKGLCLHYKLAPLNSPNLLKNSTLQAAFPTNGTITACNNPKSRSFSNGYFNIVGQSAKGNSNNGYGFIYQCSDLGITSGQSITFSADVKNSAGDLGLWFFGTDGNWWTGRNRKTSFTSQTNWTRVSVTVTAPTTLPAQIMFGMHVGQRDTTLHVRHLQVEINSKATPYLLHSDDLATATELDVSGFGFDAIKIGTFKLDTDSPRYDTSFNIASGTYLGLNKIPLTNSSNAITFAFWMKTPNNGNTMCLWNGRTAVGGSMSIFVLGGGLRFDDGAQHQMSYRVPKNEWHHYVFTRDDSDIKLYVDGVLNQTVTSKAFSGMGSKATIGASSVNSTSGSGNNFIGNLSDYRIYVTCLTAEDVAELYHTAAMVDNIGNAYVYEYIEEE